MELWGAQLFGNPCRECGFDWDLTASEAVRAVTNCAGAFAEATRGATGNERLTGWSVAEYTSHVADNLVARCRAVDRELVGSALVGTPAHLDQLTASIAREGIKVPLALGYNDHFATLDGNHRIAVALRLGLLSVPVTLTRLPDRPRPNHAQDLSARDLKIIHSAAAQRPH